MAYESTVVPVAKSQAEIRKLLTKYGAQRFSFSEGLAMDGRSWIMLEFVHAAEFDKPHLIRLAVPLKEPDKRAIDAKVNRARYGTGDTTRARVTEEMAEQEARRIWRVVYFSLKSRMEAVAEEVETFEQAFLPHIVDPASGTTLWDRIKPAVDAGMLVIGGPGLPALPSGSDS